MPESPDVRALVENSYLCIIDIAPVLGVSHQRVSQIVEGKDFPKPAKAIGQHGPWRREDVAVLA